MAKKPSDIEQGLYLFLYFKHFLWHYSIAFNSSTTINDCSMLYNFIHTFSNIKSSRVERTRVRRMIKFRIAGLAHVRRQPSLDERFDPICQLDRPLRGRKLRAEPLQRKRPVRVSWEVRRCPTDGNERQNNDYGQS